MDRIVELAVADLMEKFDPHTIILYGSYARGEATAASDVDLACFCEDTAEAKDARIFHGVYLDAWIYPTSALDDIPNESLRFGDGIAIVDELNLGASYIDRVKEKLVSGPERLADGELEHRCEWIGKMLSRVKLCDLDARFRRTWLQCELLELYFMFRNLWYLGHKKSFAYLAEHDPEALGLFEVMYAEPENLEALEAAATYVSKPLLTQAVPAPDC